MNKDPNYNRHAGIVTLDSPLYPNQRRPIRGDEDGIEIYADDELRRISQLGDDRPVQVAESPNPNWNGYDVMRAQGQRDGRILREAIKGGHIFQRNYIDMRDADTIGAGKYFHCKANCEASSLGDIGDSVAQTISNGREIVDQRIKGDPKSASVEDQRANLAGRNAGRRIRDAGTGAHQCTAACGYLRPKGLNERY